MTQAVDNRGEYEDFIGSYSNVIESSLCKNIIDTFDYYHNIGAVFCGGEQFDDTCAGRFDWGFDLKEMQSHMNGPSSEYLNQVLHECWNEYTTIFGTLKTQPFYSLCQKVQKTPTGGGYHVWHDESTGSIDVSGRIGVWMLYLNDDYEGGETEFLYYKKRIQPERGKLLIWPAGYTHVHKGNMVLAGTKYVITGWFYNAR